MSEHVIYSNREHDRREILAIIGWAIDCAKARLIECRDCHGEVEFDGFFGMYYCGNCQSLQYKGPFLLEDKR